jgi:putative endonuclease
MPNLRGVGRDAEDKAAEFLIGLGYTIVTRRFKTKRGELDIVALDGEVFVFVEVKSCRAPGFIPEEALGRTKVDDLRRAIDLYLSEMEIHPTVIRLDLIAIDNDGLRHHKDLLKP